MNFRDGVVLLSALSSQMGFWDFHDDGNIGDINFGPVTASSKWRHICRYYINKTGRITEVTLQGFIFNRNDNGFLEFDDVPSDLVSTN